MKIQTFVTNTCVTTLNRKAVTDHLNSYNNADRALLTIGFAPYGRRGNYAHWKENAEDIKTGEGVSEWLRTYEYEREDSLASMYETYLRTGGGRVVNGSFSCTYSSRLIPNETSLNFDIIEILNDEYAYTQCEEYTTAPTWTPYDHDTYYERTMNNSGSVQTRYEYQILKYYFETDRYQSYGSYLLEEKPFLFDHDKPWWAMVFMKTVWNFFNPNLSLASCQLEMEAMEDGGDPKDSPLYAVYKENNDRPKTTEEMSMLLMGSVIRGAKGFAYDRSGATPGDPKYQPINNCAHSYSNHSHIGTSSGNTKTASDGIPGIGCIENITPTEFDDYINSDFIGGDWIFESTVTDGNPYQLRNYIDWDLISNYFDWMPHEENKIYMGAKSMRKEMRRVHDWVDAVEETLMEEWIYFRPIV